MVYILKEPVDDSKGIIIFREKNILESNNMLLKKQMRRLKDKYIIVYFWARFQEEVKSIPFVDAHFAHPCSVKKFNTEQHRIKMHDMQFVPDYFENLNLPKRWDLLCIATASKNKNLHKLLKTIKMAIDEQNDFTACLIVPRPEKLKGGNWDKKFFEMYENELTEDQKGNIDLYTPLRSEASIQPIPKEFLPYLYNSAKFFTLFSENEGGPKVIAEALMCGTPIIVPSSFTGGINAYLDESNTYKFFSLNEAKNMFISIKMNHKEYEFNPDYLTDKLSASQSAERLENRFEEIFKQMDIRYKGSIKKDGLDSKLSHHKPTIPEIYRRNPARGELGSVTAAYKYIKYYIFKDTCNVYTITYEFILLDLPYRILRFIEYIIRFVDKFVPFDVYKTSKLIYFKLKNQQNKFH